MSAEKDNPHPECPLPKQGEPWLDYQERFRKWRDALEAESLKADGKD